MKLQVGSDQLLLLNPLENETLTDWLRADHEIWTFIFHRKTLPCPKIQKIDFVCKRIKIFNRRHTATLMRANVDSTFSIRVINIKSGAYPLFPGKNTTDISSEVLITHGRKITLIKVTPLQALTIDPENPLKLIGLPGVNDGGRSVRLLTKNQTMNGNVAEVQLITGRIKVGDVLREIANTDTCHGFMLLKAEQSLASSLH